MADDDKRRADTSSFQRDSAAHDSDGRPTIPIKGFPAGSGIRVGRDPDEELVTSDTPTIMPRKSEGVGDAPTILPRDSRSLGDAPTMMSRPTQPDLRNSDVRAIERQSAKALHARSMGEAPTQLPNRAIDPTSDVTLPPTGAGLARLTVDMTGRDAPTRPSMRSFPVEGETSNLRGGDLVGRYVVLGIIGAGGMGIVYLAYDPELDRRVALKVLRSEFSHLDTVGPSLLQEAKSMAQLSDPNVCTVYEVGASKGAVFIAMEYIDGETMSDWLESRPRTWKDIVEVMVQAGRGLEAAHRSGIVHRDFKPDNIMIDQQGRVRVMDFGVSERAVRKPGIRPENAEDGDVPRRDSFSSLVVGTPGYMAPEQLNAQPVDQRCDQFSYCATLYKTLYGELPYQGSTLRELREAFEQDQLVETDNHRGVPNWLRQIVLRGISINPDDRFPSVGAVVERMQKIPRQRRNIAIAALAAIALLAVVATTVLLAGKKPSVHPRLCKGAGDRVANVWNDDSRAKVKQGLVASGLPNAERMSQLVDENMTRYTSNWATMHTEACEATRVRGEQSTAMLDLRMLCLDSRLREASALTEVLATADREVAQRAAEAVLTLSDLSRCQARESLLMTDPEPDDPQVKKRLNELREILAAVKARYDAASYRDPLPRAEKLASEAADVGYGPLSAEAHLLLGMLRGQLGDLENAENTLIDAAIAARGSGAELLEAEALVALVRYMGWEGGRISVGRRWARFAEAVLKRAGGDPRLRAALARHRSALYYQEGNYQASYKLNKEALDIGLRELGEEDPAVIDALINVGGLETLIGDIDSSLKTLKKAAELAERVLGEGHPMVAEALTNRGHAYFNNNEVDEAELDYKRARDIWASSLGEDHPSVAVAITNLGQIAFTNADSDEAIKLYQQALAIEEKRFGKNARKSAGTLFELGKVYLYSEDLPNARNALERAIAIYGDSEQLQMIDAQFTLARVLWADGDRKGALQWARSARKIVSKHGDEFAKTATDIDAWLAAPE